MVKKILFLLLIILSFQLNSQSLSLFDTTVNTHRMQLCQIIERYIDPVLSTEMTHYPFRGGTYFYGIKFKNPWYEIHGEWFFVIRNDTLNQFGFSSTCKPDKEEYMKYYSAADSAIRYFTLKYGKPDRDTASYNLKNIHAWGIRKAMWLLNGQKIKVSFEYDHEDKEYKFKISRFQDYFGNFPLPAWWDGY